MIFDFKLERRLYFQLEIAFLGPLSRMPAYHLSRMLSIELVLEED